MNKSVTVSNIRRSIQKKNEKRLWARSIYILGVIIFLVLFIILSAHPDTSLDDKCAIHPGLIEIHSGDSELSIGASLIDSKGKAAKVWNIFPVHILLKSGSKKFYLGLNGLSFLTRSGIRYGKDLDIRGVHKGDVISVGGHVCVRGRIEGNVWTFGANIILMNNSVVTGDVVALGGKINTYRYARVIGNKQAVSSLQIPFLGFLTSPRSAQILLFIFEIFGILLFMFILFLVIHFYKDNLLKRVQTITYNWKSAVIYLFIGLFFIPILVLLLIVSVMGIFIIPLLFLFIIILTYLGFITLTVRIGQFFTKNDSISSGRIYVSGLLGFFIIKGFVLVGQILSIIDVDLFSGIGGVLKTLGILIIFLSFLYSFGSGLVSLRAGKNSV